MYKYSILNFYTRKLHGAILFKKYLKSIDISIEKDLTFGKYYFRIYFYPEFKFNGKEELTIKQQKELRYHFYNNNYSSGSKFVSYLEYDFNNEKFSRDRRLVRLKEFYDLYTNCTTQFTMLLQSLFKYNIKLNIESLDKFPEFNLVNKFYNDISSLDEYKYLYNSSFYSDCTQFNQLIKLSVKHKTTFDKFRKIRTISDMEIATQSYCKLSDIRGLLLNNLEDIPFKVTIRKKVVDRLDISLPKLNEAIINADKKLEQSLKWHHIYKPFLLSILKNKINEYEKAENKIKEYKKFLRLFPIKKKFIIITETNIYYVSDIIFQNQNLKFDCFNLRQDLKRGKRKTILGLNKIVKYISNRSFIENKIKYEWKSNKQAYRWINKNGLKEHTRFLKRKILIKS